MNSFKDELRKLVFSKSGKINSRKVATLKSEVLEKIKDLTVTCKTRNIVERIYLILNDVEYVEPTCQTCGEVLENAFESFSRGYTRKFCSSKCHISNPVSQQKFKATYREKTGYDNPSQNPEAIREKNARYKEKTGYDNPSQNPEVISRRSKTYFDKTGYSHQSKNPAVIEKKRANYRKKTGYDHQFLDPSVRKSITEEYEKKTGFTNPALNPAVMEQIVKTNISRYGFSRPMQNKTVSKKSVKTRIARWLPKRIESFSTIATPLFDVSEYVSCSDPLKFKCVTCSHEFYDNLDDGSIPRCPECHPSEVSEGHRQVLDFIKSVYSSEVIVNTRNIIPPLEIDIYVPAAKLAFEFNGVYWHSEVVGKGKDYHVNKTNLCEERGIKLIHLFEDEWGFKQDIVKSRIKASLGLVSRIYARKCKVQPISSSMKNDFLAKNHIQGSDSSRVAYGLLEAGELVAVMTFGVPRFNKKYDYELIRYCTKLNTTIVGGASKLLARFTADHSPRAIITYADRRWSDGNMYEKLGFTMLHHSKPSYFYVHKKSLHRENRLKYQKHKLSSILPNFDQSLSESDNMANHGYVKIWDCGTKVYIKEIK